MTNPLRRLDDRLVPTLAAFVDRVVPRTPEPTGPLPVILRLRRIDDRWARRGPLALIREIPQLGALAIAAIVLASGVTVASRDAAQDAVDGRDTEQGAGDDRVSLGPQIGDSVPAYVESARERLVDAGSGSPDSAAVAMVAFAQYRTARQVQELVGTAQVVRVWFRVPLPLPQTESREVRVQDLVADTRREFDRIAGLLEREIVELQKIIDTNDHDENQRKADEEQRDVYKREIQQLRGDCACIYSVVVQARMRVLLDLLAKPGIRVVDPSVPNARLGDYSAYTGLLPEETVTVTGGNQE